jgi:hypothetical protein
MHPLGLPALSKAAKKILKNHMPSLYKQKTVIIISPQIQQRFCNHLKILNYSNFDLKIN